MITFVTFKFNEENINELFIKLIKAHPLYFQEPARIKDIVCCFKLESSDILTLIIEHDYVDRQYRDSYYSFFSQKYSNFERNCLRLSFFEGELNHEDFISDISRIQNDLLIGFITLRPLNVGNIGHTLLNPHKLKTVGYVRTCEFKTLICGRKFTIKAFPYLSQDNETMTCAETALYNLIQYYSEKYCEYRLLMPSEILKTLEMSTYERVLPSHGADDICMAKVLQAAHLHPRLYSYDNEEGQNFDELFYAYVESGIPFILGLPQHAVICIGHGSVDLKMTHHNLKDVISFDLQEGKRMYYICTSRLVDEYIFMDDNQVPYLASTVERLTSLYYENSDSSLEITGEDIEDDFEDDFHGEKFEYSEEAIQEIKKQFDSMIVPLYKRIFLDASRAKSIFDENFLKNPDFIENIQTTYDDNTWGYSPDNPLVWRMYLTSSNSYKDFRCRTAPNADIFKYYSSQPYPRFIWVLEIGTFLTFAEKRARVEVLLDATSSRNSDTWAILSIGYKEHLVFVPYVMSCLKERQAIEANVYETDDSASQDYTSLNWKELNENVKQKVLTEIFQSLYYIPNQFVGETFQIFSNSNLKEI